MLETSDEAARSGLIRLKADDPNHGGYQPTAVARTGEIKT